MRIRDKIGAIALLTAVIAGTAVTPAFAAAEGSFTSSLSQAQPGFGSRTWTDKNSTTQTTTVKLTGCKVNLGGAAPGSTTLKSVGVALIKNGSIVGNISKACGTYDFGRLGAGQYYFRISDVNGTPCCDNRIFLNASSVVVTY